MATGSGKTVIMAGLILYLYEKGYRDFLFFVNSKTIIEKTKSNFLYPSFSKYLLNEDLCFEGKKVNMNSVESFERTNQDNINICFTTIQKLHIDLNSIKENSLTYQDFKGKKVVLLADEAHHINAIAKKGQITMSQREEEKAWEETVDHIFKQNSSNLLLEFTATLDYNNNNIRRKYIDKVLYKYELKDFCKDGYSKDIEIIHSDFDEKNRILLSVIISQYKKLVGIKYKIDLKPVILFKAQKTIKQNKENKNKFHNIINNLTEKDILEIKTRQKIPLLERVFKFFQDENKTLPVFLEQLKYDFQEKYCLSVNGENEQEKNQILLNTLEDKDNKIRAIFAVEKLNEGWDVLNLFDIVRCYEKRSLGNNKKITIREAQLIGRGARYFPFLKNNKDIIENMQVVLPFDISDKEIQYKRKFDEDLEHDLRALETLHYHSINDNQYIQELCGILNEQGLMNKDKSVKLELKGKFKETSFYQHGLIYMNTKVKKRYKENDFKEKGIFQQIYDYPIRNGQGKNIRVFSNQRDNSSQESSKNIDVERIPCHIIQNALSRNPFFAFGNIRKYCPELSSIKELITSYLCESTIRFCGNTNYISNKDYLLAMSGLLTQVEKKMKEHITKYEGTGRFKPQFVKKVLKEKLIKINEEKIRNNEDFVINKDWYVFKAAYGTSEEKACIKFFDAQMDDLRKIYDEIYLMRNERHIKIYNFKDGQGFEPDFILFLREKTGKMLTYQVFIEPKGEHLKEHDEWKEDFLRELKEKAKNQILKLDPVGSQKYQIIGLPFYNSEDEYEFRKEFDSILLLNRNEKKDS